MRHYNYNVLRTFSHDFDILHCERNFKQEVKNTKFNKKDVKKKFKDTTDLNKILKLYVGTV